MFFSRNFSKLSKHSNRFYLPLISAENNNLRVCNVRLVKKSYSDFEDDESES